MRILLDTHCLLWWLSEPEKLNKKAAAFFLDPNQDLVISSVVTWEIAIKASMKRLKLPKPPKTIISELFEEGQFSSLSIDHSHALKVFELPPHHSDPFDRLLVSQSMVENLPILTSDKQFKKYNIDIINAG